MFKFTFVLSLVVAGACGKGKEATALIEATAPTPKTQPQKTPIPSAAKPVAPTVAAYRIIAGKQIGPIQVGMSRSEVEALGVLKPHPQYSGMTIPYTVYYDEDVVTGLEVSLVHAASDIQIGEISIPKSSSMNEIAGLLSDCGEANVRIGGTSIDCLKGGLSIGIGSGNSEEIWIRIPGSSAD